VDAGGHAFQESQRAPWGTKRRAAEDASERSQPLKSPFRHSRPSRPLPAFQRASPANLRQPLVYLASIELIEAAENGAPRSLRCPRAASSAEISRSERWPPFGLFRRRRLASATSSDCVLRGSSYPRTCPRPYASGRGHRAAWRPSWPCRIRRSRRAPGAPAWPWACHR
jgi:hypothetical protein